MWGTGVIDNLLSLSPVAKPFSVYRGVCALFLFQSVNLYILMIYNQNVNKGGVTLC